MPRRLPPLNALRAFESAARQLSFVRAAEELNVTPAAVSQQVRGLEDLLSVALFRRLPRGLALTDAGRAYLPELSKGFDHLAKATDALTQPELRGPFTVSVSPSFATIWLAPRLPRFRIRHPDVDLRLRSENRPVDFAREEVDLGIRYGVPRSDGLAIWKLMEERVYLACAPSLIDAVGGLADPQDLARVALLHDFYARREEQRLFWTSWLREFGLPEDWSDRGYAFSDTAAMLQATLAGLGVAIGRSALFDDHVQAGRLARLFGVSHPADFSYYAVAPRHEADRPKTAAFVAWLRDEAGADLAES